MNKKGKIEMNQNELIEQLSDWIKKNKNEEQSVQPTFLSVIGRQYDEDLISRIVAYLLENDAGFVRELIVYYAEKSGGQTPLYLDSDFDINVKCERATDNGRIDIFASLTFGKNTIPLTIENKIKSEEHDTGDKSQTDEYAATIRRDYPDAYRVFLYLTPDWNSSSPKSKDFFKIRYSTVLEMISESTDPIVNDFINHINRFLKRENAMFTQQDIFVAKNLQAIKSMINTYMDSLNKQKSEIADELSSYLAPEMNPEIKTIRLWKADFSDVDLLQNNEIYCEQVCNRENGLGSYRLSRKEWYQNDRFYFYVEIKFQDGLFDEIYYQITLYDDNGSMKEWLKDWKIAEHSGKCYVLKKDQSKINLLESPENKEFFIKEAGQKLTNMIGEMDNIFQSVRE